MLPGLSSAECQVAWIHYQQLVKDGLHEQFKAAHHPASGSAHSTLSAIRARCQALLSGACRSLPDVRLGASEGIGHVTAQ